MTNMKDSATTTASSSSNPLEQFVLLAKSAKGAAAMELIRQVLSAPGVHVFGELLDMPNIKELENGPNINYYRTLKLFAYGTYRQYLENKDQLLELSIAEKKKLQHLTIVTLATKLKVRFL
uniref:COP9 signalosome complex subunit 7a n=1 Tax=Clastoptera arizonana TaxID=38151 RepID=A0A1B6CI91_9HEMI